MLAVWHATLVDEELIRTARQRARDDLECCIDLYDSVPALFQYPDRPILCERRHAGGTPHFAVCIPRGTQHTRRQIADLAAEAQLVVMQAEVGRRLRRAVDWDRRLGLQRRLGGYCGKRITRERALSMSIP